MNAMRTCLDSPIADIVSAIYCKKCAHLNSLTYFTISVDEDEREELLFKSIEADDFSTIKALVRLDTNIESREPEHNETSLLYAVRHGQCAIARWLLEKGADVSAANEFESTAIHIAAEVGNVWCLQDLIGHNADMNKIDDWGYRPLGHGKVQG